MQIFLVGMDPKVFEEQIATIPQNFSAPQRPEVQRLLLFENFELIDVCINSVSLHSRKMRPCRPDFADFSVLEGFTRNAMVNIVSDSAVNGQVFAVLNRPVVPLAYIEDDGMAATQEKRLRLLIGKKQLRPAPSLVVGALTSLEVRNNDRERDGFQMTFQLGRPDKKWDYPLLEDGLLDPPNHVSIVVIIQGVPEVLINGIITQHQVLPSNEPGQSQLQVTGEDMGLLLDLADHRTVHRDQSDSDIVRKIMAGYDGHRGWIYSIAVDPGFQRQGIGSELLRFAQHKLADLGCLKVNLQIMEGNEAVQQFYLANGYSAEQRVSMGMKLHKTRSFPVLQNLRQS